MYRHRFMNAPQQIYCSDVFQANSVLLILILKCIDLLSNQKLRISVFHAYILFQYINF